jgi:hypothetical protein
LLLLFIPFTTTTGIMSSGGESYRFSYLPLLLLLCLLSIVE